MGTCVSTPVGSTTSYGSMFETRLISIIGIYHSWDANISLFLCYQKIFTLQAHSWNCSTVQHFLVRTDHIAVTHNRIIIFPSPHLPCMGLHQYQSFANSMTCVRENYLRMFPKILLLSAKTIYTKSPRCSVPKSMDTKTPYIVLSTISRYQVSDHLAWGSHTPLL